MVAFYADKSSCSPLGTLFAISPTVAITCRHNIYEGTQCSVGDIGAVRELQLENAKTAFINLEIISENASEDWVALKIIGNGRFDSFVELCLDAAKLPNKNASIKILDFPSGLLTSSSSSKVIVDTHVCTLWLYERPLNDETLSTVYKIVDVPAHNNVSANSVVLVRGGRPSGSCGAPYFTEGGQVFAFHVDSINDFDEMMSNHSHASYSKGYVLCRLPEFLKWYESYPKDAV